MWCAAQGWRDLPQHGAWLDPSAVSPLKQGKSQLWIDTQFVSVHEETNISSKFVRASHCDSLDLSLHKSVPSLTLTKVLLSSTHIELTKYVPHTHTFTVIPRLASYQTASFGADLCMLKCVPSLRCNQQLMMSLVCHCTQYAIPCAIHLCTILLLIE